MIIWLIYASIYLFQLLSVFTHSNVEHYKEISDETSLINSVNYLKDICVYQHDRELYICFFKEVLQINTSSPARETVFDVQYDELQSTPTKQVYKNGREECIRDIGDEKIQYNRTLEVFLKCCSITNQNSKLMHNVDIIQYPGYNASIVSKLSINYISEVSEADACIFQLTLCSILICASNNPYLLSSGDLHGHVGDHLQYRKFSHNREEVSDEEIKSKINAFMNTSDAREDLFYESADAMIMSRKEQEYLKERTRKMFYHAYDSYMKNAFPRAELKPIACEGGNFDLIKIPAVTLVDTLDTLVVLGDFAEFRRAVKLLLAEVRDFDYDMNVSVFETTIRLLGGLLSAHLFAIDESLQIYTNSSDADAMAYTYNGELLTLAVDLADRLLLAFNTKSHIPYGTVNLRHGVPKGETKISSTAGAGSLLMEFHVLSVLTNKSVYSDIALDSMTRLFNTKSSIDLHGKHINIENNQWHETVSGIGSNADSFYEYLLKSYALLKNYRLNQLANNRNNDYDRNSRELFQMFSTCYKAIKQYILLHDRWLHDVDMFTGKIVRKRMENLDAFWPGLEANIGNTFSSAKQLNTLYAIWNDLSFLPEELDYSSWISSKVSITNPTYPLRPELIEATYHQYSSTRDRSWLQAGKSILLSIEKYTKTGCGYAIVNNLVSMELEDSMPSFFLSETCKYLYLLFDEDNFLHSRATIFSTEAHPFDTRQLHRIQAQQLNNQMQSAASSNSDSGSSREGSAGQFTVNSNRRYNTPSVVSTANTAVNKVSASRKNAVENAHLLPWKCPHVDYISAVRSAYNPREIEVIQEELSPAHAETEVVAEVESAEREAQMLDVEHRLARLSMNKHLHEAIDQHLLEQSLTEEERALQKNAFLSFEQRKLYLHEVRRKRSSFILYHLAVRYNKEKLINEHRRERQQSPAERQRETAHVDVDLLRYEKKYLYENIMEHYLGHQEEQREIFQHIKKCPLKEQTTETNSDGSGNGSAESSESTVGQSVGQGAQQVVNVRRGSKTTLQDFIELFKSAQRQLLSGAANFAALTDTSRIAEEKEEQGSGNPQVSLSMEMVGKDRSATALKTVELNAHQLGSFQIQVFSEGFHIFNSQEHLAVEVFNIGQPNVLVREYDRYQVSGSVGKLSEMFATCSLRAEVRPSGAGAVGESLRQRIFKPRTHKDFYELERRKLKNHLNEEDEEVFASNKRDAIFSRPCAQAMFGKQESMTTAETLVFFSGVPVNSSTVNELMCFKSLVHNSQSKHQDFQFYLRQLLNQRRQLTLPAPSKSPQLNAQVQSGQRGLKALLRATEQSAVVVKRGGCLFEEKAKLAEALRARALIISNQDNVLFEMAGSRDIEEELQRHSEGTIMRQRKLNSRSSKSAGKTTESAVEQEMNQAVQLPAVMITEHDAKLLQSLAEVRTDSEEQREWSSIPVEIEVNRWHSLFQHELFGNFHYPKVFLNQQVVMVWGRSYWVSYFKTTKGDDWQLYLLDKRDITTIQRIPPISIFTARAARNHGEKENDNENNQRVSIMKKSSTHTLNAPPESIYHALITRKCSSSIKVSKDGRNVIVTNLSL